MRSISLPTLGLAATISKIAEANARAAKKGYPGKITLDIGETRLVTDPVPHRVTDITVSTTKIGLPGGWTLVGVVKWEGDAPLTFTLTDDDLGIADTVTRGCDACGTNRRRDTVFVVESDEGERAQVGSTCVKDFLGVDPLSLVTFVDLVAELEHGETEPGLSTGQFSVPTVDFVAAARAAILAFGWEKASSDYPTKRAATAIIQRDLSILEEVNWANVADAAYEFAAEAIEWAAGLNPRNDFEHNLRTVAQATAIGERSFGVAAYLPVAYARDLDRRAERAAIEAARGAAEPVPEGRRVVEGTVVRLTERWTDFGVAYKMTVLDDRGFQVWSTVPRAIDPERGDRVRFTATLTRSDDDETFGFASRPSKAEVLEVVA